MATKMKGALAAASEMDEEPGEAAEGETPAYEAEEEANPQLEAGEPGEGSEDATEGPGEEATAQDKELFELIVSRTMDALAQGGRDFDSALQADPVKAAVGFGTAALRTVAAAAADAGQEISFSVLVQSGMQVIKEIGAIANDKGYLPDEGIEVYLKESFQQSLAQYTKMDLDEGKLSQEDMQKVQGALSGQQPQPPAGGGALAQAAGGA